MCAVSMNGPAEQLSARFVNVHSVLSVKAFRVKTSFPPEGVGECALTTGEIKRMRRGRVVIRRPRSKGMGEDELTHGRTLQTALQIMG